jgi:hypothetical protein
VLSVDTAIAALADDVNDAALTEVAFREMSWFVLTACARTLKQQNSTERQGHYY